jgi:phosphoesterase RecJ-like protein
MKSFASDFNTLNYIINKASGVLLFAHSCPDSDTIGANFALKNYISSLGKKVEIACFDPFPEHLKDLIQGKFVSPDIVDLDEFDVIIACDSVERGFNRIIPKISEKQVTVLIDHHPDINISGDLVIIDSSLSSVCEIVYHFFSFLKIKMNKEIATQLMIGILGDTGNLQHANTSTRVMNIASDLMKKGAHLSKIVDTVFANKKISTLKLWGRAFEKAKINNQSGMIITVLTKKRHY